MASGHWIRQQSHTNIRIVVLFAVCLLFSQRANAQLGPIGYPRSELLPPPQQMPAALGDQTPPGSEQTPSPTSSPILGSHGTSSSYFSAGLLQNVTFTATASARAAGAFDTTQLNSFAAGTFMPAAIPVKGENFYNSGERATMQGTGSAVQLALLGQTASGGVAQANAAVVFSANSSDPTTAGAQVAFASAQYNNWVAGIMDTAFADPDCIVPTIDLEGPNAIATVTGPTGASVETRLGYLFDLSGSPYLGYIASVNIESPTPEIEYTSGPSPSTTYNRFSHVPDFVATLRYVDGILTPKAALPIDEFWHLQLGAVCRDIGLENGNRTIDDSVFGWGVQLSGGFGIFPRPACNLRDAIGFSIVYGDGIGHYINDLHVLEANQTTGGNDAILNGTKLETLPAQAYYLGYLHEWTSDYQSTLGFSRVELDGVPGQVASAYHVGDWAVVNVIYHQPISLTTPGSKTATVQSLYAGVEYLYGIKEELSGNKGNDQRIMFMLSLNK